MSTLTAAIVGVLLALFLHACGVTFDDVVTLPERLWRRVRRHECVFDEDFCRICGRACDE